MCLCVCVCHQHQRQQNCCICFHIRQLCLASSVTHCEAGLNVMHWCPHGVHAGEIHRFNTSCLSTKLNLILVGAWTLRINYWSAENLILIDYVLLHDVKLAVKTAMIIGTIFLPETVCSCKYITLHYINSVCLYMKL